jgi:cytochrome c-type biogenesis protein CcmH
LPSRLVLVAALRKAPRPGAESAEADLAVYKDQLAEIERDLARGTIGAEDATRLRAEVGKRVIEADRLRKPDPLPQTMAGRGCWRG